MPKKYDAGKPKWDQQTIQSLRKHLGLTQQEMAEKMGARQQTISEWETGMYAPRGSSATLLSMIAEAANFKYDAAKRQIPNSK